MLDRMRKMLCAGATIAAVAVSSAVPAYAEGANALTLPVEFNASSRAVKSLADSGMSEEGVKAARKVLTAAALTYVAALASAIGNFLRLLSIAKRNDRNR